jgi:hypothetical protein
VAWAPQFRLRKLDLLRKGCREDPAYGLPPAEKLERIALLMGWALDLLSQKAAWRGVTVDQLMREQSIRADRRRLLRTGHA